MAAEIVWPAKPKRFIIWPLVEEVCCTLFRTMGFSKGKIPVWLISVWPPATSAKPGRQKKLNEYLTDIEWVRKQQLELDMEQQTGSK